MRTTIKNTLKFKATMNGIYEDIDIIIEATTLENAQHVARDLDATIVDIL